MVVGRGTSKQTREEETFHKLGIYLGQIKCREYLLSSCPTCKFVLMARSHLVTGDRH